MIEGKLFKWVGGKKWLSPELNDLYNKELVKENCKYYIEPFAGGLGSLLFVLPTLKEKNIETIIINDINGVLINTYKSIKNKKNKVFKEYWKLEREYKKTIPKKAFKLNPHKNKEEMKELLKDSKDYFYEIREKFNEVKDTKKVESVAYFLFLAQHSFNGLYRENASGEYNAPYNWEPGCPDRNKKKTLIEKYSEIFNEFNFIFENRDVFSFMRKYKKYSKEALFYFDPPYLNEDIAETKYNKDHFTKDKQLKLLKIMKELDNVIFSNHYLKVFEDFCQEEGFLVKKVFRSSAMNSDPSKRGKKVAEILAYKI
jgi:DNA adenine methylase